MSVGQLDLFAAPVAAPVRPMSLVTRCPRCGVVVCAVDVPGAGAPWTAGVLFGFVAQQRHECGGVAA